MENKPFKIFSIMGLELLGAVIRSTTLTFSRGHSDHVLCDNYIYTLMCDIYRMYEGLIIKFANLLQQCC